MKFTIHIHLFQKRMKFELHFHMMTSLAMEPPTSYSVETGELFP